MIPAEAVEAGWIAYMAAWINDTSRLPKDLTGYGPCGTYMRDTEGEK